MDINEMTLGQVKEIMAFAGGNSTQSIPFNIGEQYFFRTVTHIDTGRIVAVCGKFVQLEDAAWIADTGRFHEALKSCKFSEVEPYTGRPWINTDSLIDAVKVETLPLEVK